MEESIICLAAFLEDTCTGHKEKVFLISIIIYFYYKR